MSIEYKGKAVVVLKNNLEIEGQVIDRDMMGNILVEADDGKKKFIVASQIVLLKYN